MNRGAAAAVLALVVLSEGGLVSAQPPPFTPPRLGRAVLPALPAPTVAGGGEVLIEFIVDEKGAVTRPLILMGTPPYTQMMLQAIASWQFEPARAPDDRGIEVAVEAPVAVGALFRPPGLYGPTLGEPPTDVMRPSGDVAYPVEIAVPAFPPQAFMESVVLYEISLDQGGQMTSARGIALAPGFESASREALAKTRFRPATFRARPVPSTTYVLFGFRSPVVAPHR